MKNLKPIIQALVILIFLSSCIVFGQNKTNGIIQGIVTDKSSGVPLEDAVIKVIKSDDSTLFGGASTDKDGKFVISEVPEGLYTVRISFIGYNSAIAKNVTLNSTKNAINFGTIKLEVNSEYTDEIKVEDEAPAMTFENGKKVYNVEKDMAAKSGSVMDLLKNIPSVNVDNEGNVSLRGGGNVKILIDGKESALLSTGNQALQNISANTVETIEIINNPSAKYEAEGISGLINILIKKGQNIGYNGNVRVNGGTKDKYNVSTGMSLKKGDYCINGNYGFWNFYNPGHSTVNRTSFQSIESKTTMQDLFWYFKGIGHFGSLGADFDFDKFNSLSLTGNVFYYRSDFGKDNILNFYDINNNPTKYFHNYNNDGREGLGLEGALSYNKKFEEKGRDFTLLVNYSRRKQDNPVDYTNYNPDNSTYYTRADNHFTFNIVNGQADYIYPLGTESKLEAGLRSTLRLINANYKFLLRDDNSGQWLVYQNRVNDIDMNDVTSSSYATLSGKYKELTYNAGLRGEYYYRKFTLLQGAENYNQKYFNLFPNISLTQSLNKENAIQATYSRRINRPGINQLNPFVVQNDEYLKRAGNPYLNPEYVNSFELGYTRYLKFATLTLSGYFRNVTDNINILRTIDTNGAIFTRYKNTGTSNTYGLEFILQANIAKWWTVNGSANYYYNKIFNNDDAPEYNNSYNGFSSDISSNITILDLFNIRIQYSYEGVRLTPQGRMNPSHVLDIAAQKSLLDNKIMLGLRLSDIFDKDAYDLNLSTKEFSQSVHEKGNSRILFFTFAYNFGEQFKSKSQNSTQRRQREVENEIRQ